jgi:hypothetical protein
VTKPLSVADIDQLRKLLKKATKPAPMTREQRDAKRWAQRQAFKATVLTWAIEDWHRHKARLQRLCPDLWAMGLDELPTVYTSKLAARYARRDQLNY